MDTITETNLELPVLSKGKVRDTYELDDSLLMVATDRLSAFDVVFNEGIPRKGHVLNNLSAFWFDKTSHIVRNHFRSLDIPENLPENLKGRSMVVEKAEPIALECVVRGYVTGSAWKDYQKTGSVCGIKLPEGLEKGGELPEPIFTPSTKAEKGSHDKNITGENATDIVGREVFDELKQKSLELYNFGKGYALKCGLILVDTKFEFGYDKEKNIILIDEALTPDSSRYWLKEKYDQGIMESLDKQFVRDYLEQTDWDMSPPPPPLPEDVVRKTTERYLQAYKMLTGKDL